jgi:beta-phosphoglucomutase-like phosphatase (HAD superfamily)
MKDIKAVIFDMDGVLVDAREWHFIAFNRALNLFGYEINRYDHLVTYDGLPTRKKLEILSRDSALPRSLHSFINELKQRYTIELVHSMCTPTFHHEYALSRLRAEGYKLALASNSIRHSVELMMEKTNLSKYLDAMVSNEDVKKPKPDPEIYTKACAILDVSPTNCLVVEDNDNGIQSARAAGTNVMIVESVTNVTYDNIQKHIQQAKEAQA